MITSFKHQQKRDSSYLMFDFSDECKLETLSPEFCLQAKHLNILTGQTEDRESSKVSECSYFD